MKVKVEVARRGFFGRWTTEIKELDIEPGMTLSTALSNAGIPAAGMQVTIDGKPVSALDMEVADGAVIRLATAPKSVKLVHNIVSNHYPRVTLLERASGS